MGIIPQFMKRKKKKSLRNVWGLVGTKNTHSGVKVDEESSLKYLTVFSCVSLVAGDLARLPLIVFQKNKDGSRARVTDHPLYDILHTSPNEEITSFNWREACQSHLMLWGNTYNEIKRAPYSGDIISLTPITNPGGVIVKRGNRGIFYEWYEDGEKITKYRKNILHIPGFGFNGLTGISMISLAKEAIGLGLAAEQFGSTYFANGSHPSGIVTLPLEARMEEKEEKDYIDAMNKNYAGLGKHHQMMLFSNGEKYEQITIPLNDAQFLESRSFQKEEICGMFHVPPHKIAKHGNNSNYNNLEQENQNYLDACLTHWSTRWEQALSQQLLRQDERRKGIYIEFMMSGFLKGDMKARSEFYKTLFNMGYPLNRILEKENENPVEGGEEGFIPLNMIHLNRADDVLKIGDEPPQDEENEDPEEGKRAVKLIDNFNPDKNGGIAKGRSGKLYSQENRSITARDRVAGQYYPIIERAIEDVIAIEISGISKIINDGDLKEGINLFYDEFPLIVVNRLTPVLSSFAIAIKDEAAFDMGVEPDSIDIDRFISDYIKGYGTRHSRESRNQLVKLLSDGEARGYEIRNSSIIDRLDEWRALRPGKVAKNEIVRSSSAVFQTTVHSVGRSIVWRIRGKTCPFCKSLAGKRVSIGGVFLKKSETIEIEGKDPFISKGIKRHPPLHRGCDCYLEVF